MRASSRYDEPVALPTFDGFCLPVLQVLAREAAPIKKATLFALVADRAGLSPADREEVIGSGQLTYENRIGWACSWMKQAGLVANPSRAMWTITEAGRRRMARGTPITAVELRPSVDPRSRAAGRGEPAVSVVPPEAPSPPLQTPDERIDGALADIVKSVQAELLDVLRGVSPAFFEKTVLRLLKSMGYAGNLGRVEHSGRTGDGGVDGILYLDRLGLERVYVQAKRWEGSVGSSTVRDFAGAMDVAGATKGVVITTSRFSADARSYVERSPKAIRLIDGDEMAALMVEFGVGVSRERVVVLPKLDRDFFDEE